MTQMSTAETPSNPAKNNATSFKKYVDRKKVPIKLRIAVTIRPTTKDPVELIRFHCLTKEIPNMEATTPTASSMKGKTIPFGPYFEMKRTPINIPVTMSSLKVW